MPASLPRMPPDDTPSVSPSALAPLKHVAFRMLWCAWLTANVCMWMNDVAIAWMMMSLTASPVMVALVQTASTLPVFLLGLPCGALADQVDRRRYLILTQCWVAAVALLLWLAILSGLTSPALLLALTFANGIGLAMRWPVFAAIVPELVPRALLPAALALNGVSMNASRIIGPLVAGALIAAAGTAWVFALNAALSTLAALLIMRWRYAQAPASAGEQRLSGAILAGVRFAMQSASLKAVLLRIFLFFFHSTALLALLPLVAQRFQDGGTGTFTALLACMGAGTVAAALFLPRWRALLSREMLALRGTMVLSAAMCGVAFSTRAYIAAPIMFVAGMAWIATANALIVSVQLALPDWVRARGMAMYQMAIMGASAAGAAWWGQVASLGGLQTSLACAAASGAAAMLLAYRFRR